jgi:ribonuclease P protein component
MPFAFNKSKRLRNKKQFEAIYASGRVMHHAALRIHALPNGLKHHRLGLSVSRRTGNAVRRNRFKRLLREAFRQLQSEGTLGCDLVVTARPHDLLRLEDYRALLDRALHNTLEASP